MIDLRGSKLEDLAIVDFDEQKAIAGLEQQGIGLLAFLIDVPVFYGLIIDAK